MIDWYHLFAIAVALGGGYLLGFEIGFDRGKLSEKQRQLALEAAKEEEP